MKTVKLVIFILMIALSLFLVLPNPSWAEEDGAAVYKTKCAACHGAELADMIAEGGKDKKASHAFSNKRVTPDQIKMVVAYIREAQKK